MKQIHSTYNCITSMHNYTCILWCMDTQSVLTVIIIKLKKKFYCHELNQFEKKRQNKEKTIENVSVLKLVFI